MRIAAVLLALAIAVLGIAAPASAHEDANTIGHNRAHHAQHQTHHKKPKPQHGKHKPQHDTHKPQHDTHKPQPAGATKSTDAPSPTSTSGGAVGEGARTPGNGKSVGRRTTATSVTPSSSSSRTSAAVSSAAKTPSPTASSAAPAPSRSGAAANLVAQQPRAATGPQLRIAPMDGGLLAPNDRASDGRLPSDASDRLGAAQLPMQSSRIGGVNGTLALVLLLAGFAVAMAGIVSLAGHRGRRTR